VSPVPCIGQAARFGYKCGADSLMAAAMVENTHRRWRTRVSEIT
jgi:hypothetical protein